jgi:RHS repeat-associated protein
MMARLHLINEQLISNDDRVREVRGTTTRRYLYDGAGRILGEYGASASDVIAETLWLSPDAVNDNQPFGGDDGIGGYAPLAISSAPTGGTAQLIWVHGNHMGVPLAYTNTTGAEITPPAFTQIAFPGQMKTLPDLYYNRYRDYDPTTGRYIQADPIGLNGDPNPYAYAMNNPLRCSDPSGLAAAGAATGGAIGQTIGRRAGWGGAAVGREIGKRIGSAVEDVCFGGDPCWQLNEDVQDAKRRAAELGRCVPNMGRWALIQRRNAWLELAVARTRRDKKCFDNGDVNHQQAQADAWRAAGKCSELLK